MSWEHIVAIIAAGVSALMGPLVVYVFKQVMRNTDRIARLEGVVESLNVSLDQFRVEVSGRFDRMGQNLERMMSEIKADLKSLERTVSDLRVLLPKGDYESKGRDR